MRVLILGGSSEATAIARGVAGDTRFAATLSYAGRTRAPAAPPIAWRIGGFGGADGLATWLRRERIEALIDATHPFAARISANAAAAAACRGIPRVAVLRPPWVAVSGDRWTRVADMSSAFAALGPSPRRVLLTIGQQELAPFGPPHAYVIRSVDPPPDPPAGAIVLSARGPFDVAAEQALLATHRIDALVSKNSGAAATAAKLAAARALGIEVVMVSRPPPPPPPWVDTAEAALAWLHHAARGV